MTTHVIPAPGNLTALPPSVYDIRPGTQVVIEAGGLNKRFRTRYIGQERGHYFLIRMPTAVASTNLYEYLYTGNTIVVRYIKDGKIWGFASEIQGHIAKPQPLLFLDFPTQVESHNLRQAPRIDCHFPVTSLIRGIDVDCIITDISPRGCKLRLASADCTVEIGDEVGIACSVFGATGQSMLIGSVRRKSLTVSSTGAVPELGIGFTNVKENTLDAIRDYVQRVTDIICIPA